MCCVMPPASPDTTLALRMASSSEVLPWSTWPMMVTTGGRGCRSSGLSSALKTPSSMSASATRRTVWPNSVRHQFGRVGVDHVAGLHDLALLHEELHDVDRALRHAVGEVGDGNRLGQDHFAQHLLARLVVHRALELFLAAAHRRQRAGARLFLGGGRVQRQLAAAAVFLALGARRPRGFGRREAARRQAACAALRLCACRLHRAPASASGVRRRASSSARRRDSASASRRASSSA